ncbi:hypothetical protein CANARDRAFT_177906 [[Candida] arabinofermentans NRRL YB-2248]|uniref:ATP-dependent RNA helicase n=1 Tax=[Candida] arabinofermentans NRRL YB-2248 TaxID=983967 RepID=A0A1E4SUD8_9ASCO|nr:hypothetical protein CANARDRAFT_177906 [[Candida] arabinofermentans NRRL YB-2248]
MGNQTKLQEAGLTKEESIDEQQEDIKDIAPLPQPKLPTDKNLYSNIHKNKNLNWLTTPQYHDTTTRKQFSDFKPNLNSQIINNLKDKFGIDSAFSVQVQVIEPLLQTIEQSKLTPIPIGDYLVNASTGSGKTLAYLIPIVQSLMNRVVPKLRCIILVPTKPLISQVYTNLLNLTKGINLNVMVFKTDLNLKDEYNKFQTIMPDILITTPGRLVDHITNHDVDLSQLRFLIIDEADRLLNQSFQNWCDLLISKLDSQQSYTNTNIYNNFKIKCSKLIFSATLTTDSEKLSHLKLFQPKLIVINDTDHLVNELYQLPINLDEFFIKVPEALSLYKPLILMNFLNDQHGYNDHGLIFTKSNESSIRLTRLLNILKEKFNIDLKIHSINSSLKNQERTKILKQFDNDGGLLISTDLISRGLNLESIKFVINYDLPLSTKEYIHRVGRTARANKHGNALTFCYGDGEFKWFKKLVYSGGVINRNKKLINEIQFVKQKTKNVEKKYDLCLKQLQSEV